MKNVICVVLGLLISMNLICEERNEIVWAHESDQLMNKAISDARASLDGFLEKYKNNEPNVDGYTLKVMFTEGDSVEHFWIIPFRLREGGGFEGILANEPRVVKNLVHSQLVSFSRSMITDWGYKENGKKYGNYTTCALFKAMPKDQVEYYRKNHGFQC